MGTNIVILRGNLCAAPELFQTRSGRPKLVFKLAVDREPGRVPKHGGKGRGADFIPVVAYGDIAQQAFPYLQRGTEVLVEGFWQSRDLPGHAGGPRTVSEVVAEKITFLAKARHGRGEI